MEMLWIDDALNPGVRRGHNPFGADRHVQALLRTIFTGMSFGPVPMPRRIPADGTPRAAGEG